LGPAEVRELEQLAQAFPYCQTAHLLLAKAAHDQGTMLAGQRLRRAATYAADRALLRRLIESVVPPVTAALEVEQPVAPAQPTEVPAVPAETAPITDAAPAPEPEAAPVVVAVAPVAESNSASLPEPVVAVAPSQPIMPAAEPVPVIEAPSATLETSEPQQTNRELVETRPLAIPVATTVPTEAVITPAQPLVPLVHLDAEVETASVIESPTAVVAITAAAEPNLEATTTAEEAIPSTPAMPLEAAEIAAPAEAMPVESAVLIDQPDGEVASTTDLPAAVPPAAIVEAVEPDLPPQAPAVRPPAEVGEARFEFGLAEAPAATPAPAYELPGLVDEWAASAVTRSLAGPDLLTNVLPEPIGPVFTPAAFTGDATIGYGFGESSRLGFSLQLLNYLTDKAEAAETVLPIAAPLPPAGSFFEPDPLLLEHWATHSPPAPVLPSSLDLINNFLRRQPRLTRPAMLPPTPGSQTDLSVRSTRAEPDLASESLARILVRQGKTARAIEIYEKLMVKQPEKMAYFAAQIQLLQPPA